MQGHGRESSGGQMQGGQGQGRGRESSGGQMQGRGQESSGGQIQGGRGRESSGGQMQGRGQESSGNGRTQGHGDGGSARTRAGEPFQKIVCDAMSFAFGYQPYPFQLDVISHIIQMGARRPSSETRHPITPTLLVRGTGGGKSCVYQTVGIIKCGVIIIIQNTLALSSDQLSKLKNVSTRIPNTFAIQLDSVKQKNDQIRVAETATSVNVQSDTTFFLFTSPETLQIPVWSTMLKRLIQKKTLKYVCIDEVHQFISFATLFRSSFLKLKTILFDAINITPSSNTTSTQLRIPLTFMTATFDKMRLDLLTKMTGFIFTPNSIFWSNIDDFDRRNIKLNLIYSPMKYKCIKELLSAHCHNDNLERKSIIYSNIAKSTEGIRDEIDKYLDNIGILGDTILINGDLEKEWKYVSTQKFTEITADIQSVVNSNTFYGRFLIATSGCIGAGLDSSEVDSVIRDGFPLNTIDFIQEMGRSGRGICNDSQMRRRGHYELVVNIRSFVYLVERIYNDDGSGTSELDDDIQLLQHNLISKEEHQRWQLKELISVLQLMYLVQGCLHVQLEKRSILDGVECSASSINGPCNDSCPYCLDKMKGYIPVVSRAGLSRFLIDVFLQGNQTEPSSPENVVKWLTNYDDVGTTVFKRRVNTAPKASLVTGLVLQLIASEILTLKVVDMNQKKTAILRLNVVDEIGTLASTRDEYWNGFLME